MSRKTMAQFGAGNIGRSLAGALFARAGYVVTFADVNANVIGALNARGRYTIRLKDDLPPGAPDTVEIENVRGVLATDADAVADLVAKADILGTAVGAAVLPKILPTIAKGLARRTTPVSILFCENLRGAAAIARAELAKHLPPGFDLAHRVGLVETSIGKMVPIMPAEVAARDPLEVWAEAYNRIVADREGFLGEPPDVEGLVCKKHFAAYVDRKLFIHNLGHATAAYHGGLAGKTYLWECMEDAPVRAAAEAAMTAAARALIRRYPSEFDDANQREHVDDLLRRFHNKALGDTVFRVGRDLARKLSPEDRCVGALRLILAEGGDAEPVIRTIAAALRFAATDEAGAPFPADAALVREAAERGPEAVLVRLAGFDAARDRALLDRIARAYAANA